MEEGYQRHPSFPTTQWSLILRATATDPTEREKALADIFKLYWLPVYAFIRSRGNSPHDAEDLTQSLFVTLIEREDFAKVDAAYGKLRSYLLAVAKNLLASEIRKQQRQKRGGDHIILSIDAEKAEQRCLMNDLADNLSPDRIFERQWAITVMEQVIINLETRYQEKGQQIIFQTLKPFISLGSPAASQAELARQLGLSEQAFRVTLHRLRQRYKDELHRVVRATLGSEDNLEEELNHLLRVFD